MMAIGIRHGKDFWSRVTAVPALRPTRTFRDGVPADIEQDSGRLVGKSLLECLHCDNRRPR